MVGSSDAGRRQRRQARGRSRGEAAGDEARVSSLYACAGGRSGAIGRRKMEIEKESGVECDTGGGWDRAAVPWRREENEEWDRERVASGDRLG